MFGFYWIIIIAIENLYIAYMLGIEYTATCGRQVSTQVSNTTTDIETGGNGDDTDCSVATETGYEGALDEDAIIVFPGGVLVVLVAAAAVIAGAGAIFGMHTRFGYSFAAAVCACAAVAVGWLDMRPESPAEWLNVRAGRYWYKDAIAKESAFQKVMVRSMLLSFLSSTFFSDNSVQGPPSTDRMRSRP